VSIPYIAFQYDGCILTTRKVLSKKIYTGLRVLHFCLAIFYITPVKLALFLVLRVFLLEK